LKPKPQSGRVATEGGWMGLQNASPLLGLGSVMLKQGSVIGPWVQFGIGTGGNGDVGPLVASCVGEKVEEGVGTVAATVGDGVGEDVGALVGDGFGS